MRVVNSKIMSIIELIEKVGMENITVQFLSDSIVGTVTTNKKGITKFSVATKEISCGDIAMNKGKVGMIVWLPRDKIPTP